MRWFPRHARACRGHPRLSCEPSAKRRGWPGQARPRLRVNGSTRRHDATLRFRRRKGVACGRAHSLVDEPLEAPAIEILADVDVAFAVDREGMGHVQRSAEYPL